MKCKGFELCGVHSVATMKLNEIHRKIPRKSQTNNLRVKQESQKVRKYSEWKQQHTISKFVIAKAVFWGFVALTASIWRGWSGWCCGVVG